MFASRQYFWHTKCAVEERLDCLLLYLGVNKWQQEWLVLTPEEIGLPTFGIMEIKVKMVHISFEILKIKSSFH